MNFIQVCHEREEADDINGEIDNVNFWVTDVKRS